MKSLSVSSARSKLPSLLNDVFIKHETIISRNGKPVAQLSPLDAIASTQLPGNFHKDPADRIIVLGDIDT